MGKGLLATTAALASALGWTLSASAADAADFYKAPSPVPYGYSWMGPYVGANLGYEWGQLSNSGAKPSGIAGGFQGGYNWQFGQFVVGAETDLQLSDSNDVFANYKFTNPWFGTVRGRGGLALNNILFYGTLGLAYGRGHVDVGGFSEDNMHVGWAGGAGLEVGLTQNWSVRAEYLYIDLSSEGYVLTGTNNGLQSNLVRFGVNYRF
jgi:outer membrane immunogenic protein